jgi:hypothetical protein
MSDEFHGLLGDVRECVRRKTVTSYEL